MNFEKCFAEKRDKFCTFPDFISVCTCRNVCWQMLDRLVTENKVRNHPSTQNCCCWAMLATFVLSTNGSNGMLAALF